MVVVRCIFAMNAVNIWQTTSVCTKQQAQTMGGRWRFAFSKSFPISFSFGNLFLACLELALCRFIAEKKVGQKAAMTVCWDRCSHNFFVWKLLIYCLLYLCKLTCNLFPDRPTWLRRHVRSAYFFFSVSAKSEIHTFSDSINFGVNRPMIKTKIGRRKRVHHIAV